MCSTDPLQPSRTLADGFDGETSGCWLAALAVRQAGELEDVGMPGRNAHHTLPVPADQERDVMLNRPDAEVVDGDLVMRPAAQSVDRRSSPGQQRWLMEFVVEHQGAHP